jgi:hypothetical protein
MGPITSKVKKRTRPLDPQKGIGRSIANRPSREVVRMWTVKLQCQQKAQGGRRSEGKFVISDARPLVCSACDVFRP